MASEDDCDSNLTLDAYPSPPRVEENNETPMKTPQGLDPEEPIQKPPLRKPKKNKRKNCSNEGLCYVSVSNSKNVHVGPNNTYIMSSPESNNKHSETVVKTLAIKHLLSLRDPITDDDLYFVAENVGQNWKMAMRRIGYKKATLDQFYESYFPKGNVQEVVYQILLDWKQVAPEQAQRGILFKALWKAKEYDVVQAMANKLQDTTI